MRKPRRLSSEEKTLWRSVAKTAEAFPGREMAEEPMPAEALETTRPPEPAAAAPVSITAPKRHASAPQLAPFERRLLSRLQRGVTPIDGRIDLHGLTQHEAHGRLAGYLKHAQSRGDRVVLIITGKGRPGGGGEMYEERGVLRRSVPHWLAAPDLRPIVIGFEQAHAAHGGSGALYVRLRRSRTVGG